MPVYADICLPGLSALAAKVLNAEQTSYSMESGLQVMASMAAFITHMKESKGKALVKADVVAFAKSSMPECRDCLPTDFAWYCSACMNGLVLQFLDSYAR